jgi:hypothetical protein
MREKEWEDYIKQHPERIKRGCYEYCYGIPLGRDVVVFLKNKEIIKGQLTFNQNYVLDEYRIANLLSLKIDGFSQIKPEDLDNIMTIEDYEIDERMKLKWK